ncbi:hypothetical protein [Luteipulveratus mongoliensis]|uniref:Uncharacterized protein n=1 Tax=Luteipulveratus mongoliensis TaxID=571913 RepID=A0A0K1JIS1_9MICO|nr:hypothetical protein [Luteipulveratus mongoliensis]AKU16601.1 hypothetical protein VV02_13235 [Luteipulveratus mongoliensis]
MAQNDGPQRPDDRSTTSYEMGVELSVWPALKVRRAEQLAAELGAAVNLWWQAANVRTEFSEGGDANTAYLLLRVDEAPAVLQWSLLFGDFVHNLRAALDALTWELATYDGRQPEYPTRVAFPICTEPDDWKERRWDKWLASVPADALERIKDAQPYQRVHDEPHVALALISKLDNLDKHRSSVRVRLHTNGTPSVLAKFKDESRGGTFQPAYISDAPLRDGVPIVRLESDRPIASLEATGALPLAARVDIDERSYDLSDLLDGLVTQVQNTMATIMLDRPDDSTGRHVGDAST